MDTILIVARFALAAVFLVAAIAKLADMSGSRDALEGFGLTARSGRLAAIALPVAEILAAVLLLPGSTAQLGAALTVALLLAFVLGIAAALRRGTTPDCHCFGQLHSRPAGKETIGRNGGLAAVSLLVLLAGPGPSPGAWLKSNSGDVIGLAATSLVAVVLAYICATLWRENRRLTGHGPRPDMPTPIEVGQVAPQFAATDLAGGRVASADLLDGAQRTVLVFTSATCGPCVGLLPELARWRQMLAGRLAVHVLAAGDEGENRRLSDEHGMPVLLDRDAAVANAFGIVATPSALELDSSGQVAGPPAAGGPAIEGLIRAALKRPASSSTPLQVRQVAATSMGAADVSA